MDEYTTETSVQQPPVGVPPIGTEPPRDNKRIIIIALIVAALLGLCLCGTFVASLVWFQRAVTRDRLAIDWNADPDYVPDPQPMPQVDPLPESDPYPGQSDAYPENVYEARFDEELELGGLLISASRAATEAPIIEIFIENLSDSDVTITTWGARDLAGNALAYHEVTGARIPEGGVIKANQAYDFGVMFRDTSNTISDFGQVVLHLSAPIDGYNAIVFK